MKQSAHLIAGATRIFGLTDCSRFVGAIRPHSFPNMFCIITNIKSPLSSPSPAYISYFG
jgi:hypothetical protein